MREIVIEKNEAGQRLDKFLAKYMNEASKSFFYKMMRKKNITLNGKKCEGNEKLAEGDVVKLFLAEDTIEKFSSVQVQEVKKVDLDILYEDDDILVVNKPKGMVVHPAAGHYTGTLVNAIMYHCKDRLSGINGVMRPGIVHRIDMDTTGSLLVCKNDTAHQILAEQLKEHSIKRIYHAIVHGNIKEDSGTVNAPIGRHPIDRKKMSINEKNGRNAVTHYRVLERFGDYTYIACELETGRTHQIRVHMASIHHPLLGDCVYGPAKCPWTLQGQTLHAKILGIIHPRTGKYMEFDAPLPEYFENLLKKLRKMS